MWKCLFVQELLHACNFRGIAHYILHSMLCATPTRMCVANPLFCRYRTSYGIETQNIASLLSLFDWGAYFTLSPKTLANYWYYTFDQIMHYFATSGVKSTFVAR